MSFKTIVLSLDDPQSAEVLINAATIVCERHQAHLIGLYVIPAPESYGIVDFPVPYDLLNGHETFYEKRSNALRQAFETATAGQNFQSEWRSVQCYQQSVINTISSIANTADLLIISPANQAAIRGVQSNTAEWVLLNTCRPVNFVPADSTFSGMGKNCFIAFDGSKESAKAVFDAIPVLQLAETVQMHQVNPDASESHRLLGRAGDLVQTLSRHGVEVELSQSVIAGGSVATELMTVAREKGADLIIMGAYGHSRFREKMFGGTTRSFLKEMPVPVMMSC